jgi:hypothetical protein
VQQHDWIRKTLTPLRVLSPVIVLVLLALALNSCRKNERNPVAPPGPTRETAHISGRVRDASDQPLANVALHMVYVLDQPGAAEPMQPSVVTFVNLTQILYTECGGSTPLLDGVIVRILWDQNGNGPDDLDQPPPLCDAPPDCEAGPARTVNINEFPINGEVLELGAGLFYMDPAMVTVADQLSPNRFYTRIYCADGRVLYTSNVVEPPSGPSEMPLTFTCTPCEGAPVVPDWQLDQSYPNPAVDSVTFHFGVREAADVLLTLGPITGTVTDTVAVGHYWSGGHSIDTVLGDRPNGLYEVHLSAGSFDARHTLLKNVEDYNRLRITRAAALSELDGSFSFEAAAGETVQRRGRQGEVEGSSVLTRLKVVAIRSGYQMSDTTLDVAAGGDYAVNLRLVPE